MAFALTTDFPQGTWGGYNHLKFSRQLQSSVQGGKIWRKKAADNLVSINASAACLMNFTGTFLW